MNTTQLLADASTQTGTQSGSGGTSAVVLLFCLLCGLAGFQRARTIRKETGRTPWGLASWGWLLFCLFLPLIGLVCVIVASKSERARAAMMGFAGVPHGLPAPYVPPQPGVPQAPVTIEQAWAPPAYGSQGSGFPPPVAPPPVSGARIAVDVLPADQPKRRFR